MEPDFINAYLANPALHNNWTAITGFVVLTLVYVLKRSGFVNKLPPKYVPTVSIAFGVLLAFGDKLLTSQSAVWYQTLIQGLVAGVSATGLWELVFKHVLGEAALNPPGADVPPVVVDTTTPPVVDTNPPNLPSA